MIPTGVTRRQFVATAAATGAFAFLPGLRRFAKRPPNVLFILADDMGYGDLSSFGRPDYKTPVLDRFARDGLRLTSVYTAGAVCTPTRCAWVTGRYPQRLPIGLVEPLTDGDNSVGLPTGHPTVASLVKAVGYDTSLIGKWHLGFLPEHHPLAHGFDEFYGVIAGAADYFTHKNQLGELDLHEGMVTSQQQGYITNLLTDRAVAYLKKKRSRPFYLSLHYTSPHWPWEGPADQAWSDSIVAHKLNYRDGGSPKVYASMVRNLDDSVARVMRALREGGHEENTLVVFTSDNGGERWSYNWPMSESKGSLHEGGIRVPGAIRWPGVIPPGSASDRPVITMDWTATILATAGASADPGYPLDGVDLTPLWHGGGPDPSRALFWRTRKEEAVRRGHWKYWRGAADGLFDVVSDPGEAANRIGQYPDLATPLKQAWSEWNAGMLPIPPARGRGPG